MKFCTDSFRGSIFQVGRQSCTEFIFYSPTFWLRLAGVRADGLENFELLQSIRPYKFAALY